MQITKDHIIEEIRRAATENGGSPLGWRRFSAATGIKIEDLYKNSYARYSDACVEAGFKANDLTGPRDTTELLEKYAELCLELGRLPGKGDLRVKALADKSFPHDKTLRRALGSKEDLIDKLLLHCQADPKYSGVVKLCEAKGPRQESPSEDAISSPRRIGYVYLIKHGSRREYKIGRTYNALRREGEISIELPEKVIPVHVISTDDPAGIETYWHNRFGAKRKNGEWFELSAADVAAFRRRIFM